MKVKGHVFSCPVRPPDIDGEELVVCANSVVRVATLRKHFKGICHSPHSMLVAAFVAVVFGSM